MSVLGMSELEYDYWISTISEGLKLIGNDAKLLQVEDISRDIYYDVDNITFEEATDIGILFEDNPKPILKKMGWLTEDEELPFVAYICSKDNNLQALNISTHMLIYVPSKYGVKDTKIFNVTSIRGSSINPLMWICKLVPYRPKLDFNADTPEIEHTIIDNGDDNYSYLLVDK